MASVVLASRNEPQWGEHRVYMRKISISNLNTNSNLGSYLNPNPNSNFAGDVDSEETLPGAAVGVAISDDCYSFSRQPATTTAGQRDGDYVTFELASFSRRERQELKRRLVFELEQVRAVIGRFHSHSSPSTNHFQQPSQAQQKVKSVIMKRCSAILTKLMKQRGARWFNQPVDIEGLGLHDYHQIIKSPMDLGTVKAKLRKGVYGAPPDFAADVRLTFSNAILYNPANDEVHILAEQFLKFFDNLFDTAYKKYQQQMAAIAHDEAMQQQYKKCLPPTTQKLHALPPPPPPQPPQPSSVAVGRTGFMKQLPKPKAKDRNKRPMSLEEKEKLSSGLQNLPQEKMEQVVHILRRRNGVQAQDGDEIELDLELMDNETLWELDRFLSNYKKSINKIKQREVTPTVASAAPASPPLRRPNGGDMSLEVQEEPVAGKNLRVEPGDEDVDIGEDIPAANYPPVEIDKNDGGQNSSSSSSSGSSDSSSSSDSDSDSSSDSDSDDDDAKSP